MKRFLIILGLIVLVLVLMITGPGKEDKDGGKPTPPPPISEPDGLPLPPTPIPEPNGPLPPPIIQRVKPNVVALYTTNPARTAFEVTGENFGSPQENSVIEITPKGSAPLVFKSTASEIVLWKDNRITVKVEKVIAQGGAVRVKKGNAEILSEPITETFEYSWYSMPSTQGSSAPPLAVAVDKKGRVWINQEFHTHLHVWEPATEKVRHIEIPLPSREVVTSDIGAEGSNPSDLTRGGPFSSIFLGKDTRTPISQNGEDIKVDREGNVWFTQGGGVRSDQYRYPNKSRVVRYDPDAPEGKRFRVYTIPGDNNQIVGLAFDEKRDRIWITADSHDLENYIEDGKLVQIKERVPAKLISFDPDRVPYTDGTTEDYTRASKKLFCAPDVANDRECYHEYPVPGGDFLTHTAAHLVVDPSGDVWYTAYWGGNYIGRLDPETSKFQRYPLPKPVGTSAPVNSIAPFYAGPWEIKRAPNGDLGFSEFFDTSVSRFKMNRLGKECLTLKNDKNPCIDTWVIPESSLEKNRVHSVAYDEKGNLWFTHSGGGKDSATLTNTSIGYVSSDWSMIIKLPPLRLFTGDYFSGSGITVDGWRGDIWFGDYDQKRLGRLQRR